MPLRSGGMVGGIQKPEVDGREIQNFEYFLN